MSVQTMAYNTPNATHNDYMDMIQLPMRAHINHAYENTIDLSEYHTVNDLEDHTSTFNNRIRVTQHQGMHDDKDHTGKGRIQNMHDYEDPSKMTPHPLLSRYRHKCNDLYEPTGPLQARKVFIDAGDRQSKEAAKEKTESCCSRLVLGLILIVSVAALVLVALMINGLIGPTCLCSKQGKVYHHNTL